MGITKEKHFASPLILPDKNKVYLPRFWKGQWSKQDEVLVFQNFKGVSKKDIQLASAYNGIRPEVVVKVAKSSVLDDVFDAEIRANVPEYQRTIFTIDSRGDIATSAKYAKCAVNALQEFTTTQKGSMHVTEAIDQNKKNTTRVFEACLHRNTLPMKDIKWNLTSNNFYSPP